MEGKEREYETGMDEFWKAMMSNLANNMKRTYDEYQNQSLESVKQFQAYIQKVISDAQDNTEAQRTIANQALQNAVETANMVGKQAVRHGDIAIDRQWNVNETDAYATIMATLIAEKLKAK